MNRKELRENKREGGKSGGGGGGGGRGDELFHSGSGGKALGYLSRRQSGGRTKGRGKKMERGLGPFHGSERAVGNIRPWGSRSDAAA